MDLGVAGNTCLLPEMATCPNPWNHMHVLPYVTGGLRLLRWGDYLRFYRSVQWNPKGFIRERGGQRLEGCICCLEEGTKPRNLGSLPKKEHQTETDAPLGSYGGMQPFWHLHSGLVTHIVESGLQNRKVLSLHCLKQLSVGWSVTAATGNSHGAHL